MGKYVNRYGDEFVFEMDENGDIIWTGNFEYVRMVESVRYKISMADPSGGPYICVGMPLTDFGFKGLVVKDIEPLDSGYKIIVEK
jgi:hypothetical protein